MKIKDPKTGKFIEYPDAQIKKLDPDPELQRYYQIPNDDLTHLKPKDEDILKEEIYNKPILKAEDYLFEMASKKKKNPSKTG